MSFVFDVRSHLLDFGPLSLLSIRRIKRIPDLCNRVDIMPINNGNIHVGVIIEYT
jgi:hypothetical protein